jgi:hypothetical protein
VYFVTHSFPKICIFIIHIVSYKMLFHQVLFLHPSISADLLGLLDYHPFWMNVIHFWWILTMVWNGCYKLAYCLGWSSIFGCMAPSILVGIYHVKEWMLQICFLSQ